MLEIQGIRVEGGTKKETYIIMLIVEQYYYS